jgi:hypothetical protein
MLFNKGLCIPSTVGSFSQDQCTTDNDDCFTSGNSRYPSSYVNNLGNSLDRCNSNTSIIDTKKRYSIGIRIARIVIVLFLKITTSV